MENLIKNSISTSLTYSEYNNLMQECVSQQKTTGNEQSVERIEFTKLNASRMKRLDKTTKFSNETIEAFNNIQKQTWIVISESWCGDAAQTLPVLNKMAENSSSIQLKIVLRDSNLEFMNSFLTNGAQAVPKLIIVDEEYTVMNTWGARSKAATQLVLDYKKEHGKIDAQFKKDLQIWYNKDKGQSIINDLFEITSLIKTPV
jgi:hypothetical protein